MTPIVFLGLMIAITGGAAAGEWFRRRRHRARLQKLADDWRMAYSARDQFRLLPRVARWFPVPGASNIRVLDLIYGADQNEFRYIFTAEYTTGVVSGKRRIQRVALMSESREKLMFLEKSEVKLAPLRLRLMQQYLEFSPEKIRNSPV